MIRSTGFFLFRLLVRVAWLHFGETVTFSLPQLSDQFPSCVIVSSTQLLIIEFALPLIFGTENINGWSLRFRPQYLNPWVVRCVNQSLGTAYFIFVLTHSLLVLFTGYRTDDYGICSVYMKSSGFFLLFGFSFASDDWISNELRLFISDMKPAHHPELQKRFASFLLQRNIIQFQRTIARYHHLEIRLFGLQADTLVASYYSGVVAS